MAIHLSYCRPYLFEHCWLMLALKLQHRSAANKALFFCKQFEGEIRKAHDQEINNGQPEIVNGHCN
jgi:hypothetical protein